MTVLPAYHELKAAHDLLVSQIDVITRWNDNLRADRAKLTEENRTLATEIKNLATTVEDQKAYITELHSKANELYRELGRNENTIANLNQEISYLRERISK